MNKYFSTIEKNNDLYVGIIYDNNTNQEVHRTNLYPTQVQASQAIDSFLTGEQPTVVQAIRTSTTPPSVAKAEPTRRCCGR